MVRWGPKTAANVAVVFVSASVTNVAVIHPLANIYFSIFVILNYIF